MRRLGIVIFGASIFENHDDLSNPRLAASASEFRRVCSDRKIMAEGFPKILNLFDKTLSPSEITAKIVDFLSQGYEYVIIYYCGHGDVPRKADYSVFLRNSQRRLRGTLLSVGTLIQDLAVALAGKKVFIVLDACFSSEVIEQLGEFQDATAGASLIEQNLFDNLPQTGMAVFTASQAIALVKNEDKVTVFTGAFADCLRNGIAQLSHQQTLSWLDVRNQMASAIRARLGRDAPNPRIWTRDDRRGDVTQMPFFINRAYVPEAMESAVGNKEIEHYFWKRIPEDADIDLFDDFLVKFPNSDYASVALALIKTRVAGKSARELESFVRDFPQSRGLAFARSRLAALAWEQAGISRDVAALEQFIKTYSYWEKLDDAKHRLEFVRKDLVDEETQWNSIETSADAHALTEFLTAYPNGRFAKAARERLMEIRAPAALEPSLPPAPPQPSLAERIRIAFNNATPRVRLAVAVGAILLPAAAAITLLWIGLETRTSDVQATQTKTQPQAQVRAPLRPDQDRAELDTLGSDIAKLRNFLAHCQASSCSVEQEARKRIADAEMIEAQTQVRARQERLDQDLKDLNAQGTDVAKLRNFLARCQAPACGVEQEARQRLANAEAAERARQVRLDQDRRDLDAQGTDITKLRNFLVRCQAPACGVEQDTRQRLADAEAAERARQVRLDQDRRDLDAQGTDITKLRNFLVRCQAPACGVEQDTRQRLADAEAAAERARLARLDQDHRDLDAQGTDITNLRNFLARCQAPACGVERDARQRLAKAEAAAERVRQASAFNAYPNYDLKITGEPTRQIDEISLSECESACRASSECKGYTFNKWNRRCFLKSELGTLFFDARADSGFRRTVQTPPPTSNGNKRFCVFVGSTLTGTLLATHPSTSADDCKGICDGDASCLAYTFLPRRECRMFSETTQRTSGTAGTSGVKAQTPDCRR